MNRIIQNLFKSRNIVVKQSRPIMTHSDHTFSFIPGRLDTFYRAKYTDNYNLLKNESSKLTLIKKYSIIFDSLDEAYEQMDNYDMMIEDCMESGTKKYIKVY